MTRGAAIARRLASLLPTGAPLVGSGLAVLGVAAYVYLAIAGHALSAVAYADLAVLWMIVFSVGPGLFFPLEQELSRLVADRLARGLGARPVAVRIALAGGLLLSGSAATLLLLRAPLTTLIFDGQPHMVEVLALNLAALTVAHLSRGLLSGHGEFGRYGAQLALDGALRCGLAGALALSGVGSPAAYGLVLAIAPLAAVALTASRRALTPGPAVACSAVTAGMGLLIVSSMLWLALVNANVVSARVLAGPAEAALAGALLAGVVLSRIPLFAFSAVQASLLPALSGVAAAGDLAGFRRLLARTVGAVAAMGAAGAVVCVGAGPWLAPALFGVEAVLGRGDFALLGVATVVYMIATVFGQAGLALAGHRDQAVGWAAGFAVLLLTTLIPVGILLRVELAFLAGSTTACAVLGGRLLRRVRRYPESAAAPIATASTGSGLVD